MQKNKQSTSVTQDFFPRSGKAVQQKTQGFMFNQAPLNKRQAQQDAKEFVAEKGVAAAGTHTKKRSAFMAKLYQNESEKLDEEMRVFDMDRKLSSDDDEDKPAKVLGDKKKRQSKADDKKDPKNRDKSKQREVSATVSKIAQLKFSPGSVGLFAISEVHSKYLIVNYTRNTKGYISIEVLGEDKSKLFEIGQLVVASVIKQGTSQFNEQSTGNLNRKLQLTLQAALINKSLTSETVAPGHVLQGEIESKEAKGFLLNFGLKDKSKGFLSLNENTEHFQIGQLVLVQVVQVLANSKVIKTELATEVSKHLNNKETTIHNLKPGTMVSGKVSGIMDNGIEVSFLTGFKGTIFADHLDKESSQKYKVGEKINARIIFVDPQTQIISLTLLPHLIKLQNVAQQFAAQGLQVGKVFDQSKISALIFGGSFKVKLAQDVEGFLHKIHAVKAVKDKESEEIKYEKLEDLEVGKILPSKIRVKEFNYFDGLPILSMREDLLSSAALHYGALQSGQYVETVVEEIGPNYLALKVNDFVKGRLYIEHMADFPLKTMPPKLAQVGKTIKVRVFNVEAESRTLEFTKKDSLLKAKTPVYQSHRDLTKGSKFVGVIVDDKNEHGIVVKSFSGLKGLLTFQDIKENGGSKKRDLKIGSMLKAYVLFKKKDQGMALTLDKQKAKELRKEAKEKLGKKKQAAAENAEDNENKLVSLDQQIPKDDELAALKDKYKSMLKASQSASNVGKVMSFRVIERRESYLVCKSLDAPKKAQNLVAILPLCLVHKQNLHSITLEDVSFPGLIMDLPEDSLPIISAKQDLIALKDSVPSMNSDFKDFPVNSFVGIVGETSRKGVTIFFLNGLKRLVLVKDLETVQNFQDIYSIGKVVRCANNKLERLCLKNAVVYHPGTEKTQKADKELQITAFYQQIAKVLELEQVKIGEKVEAEISLVKDYGNIVTVEKYPGLTGFILTEHLIAGKSYKEGDKVQALVMDIDFEKEIIDLSERLCQKSSKKHESPKVGHNYKAIVELNKEDYLLISFKGLSGMGLLMTQSFNHDKLPNPNEKYSMGDEVEVTVKEITESGFVLTLPVEAIIEKKKSTHAHETVKLEVGALVKGQIRSIKGQCAFLQLSHQSQLIIGRLHRLETQSAAEWSGYTVGETIEAKILQIKEDNKKTWIELTRRKEHLQSAKGLDQKLLKESISSLEDLKSGLSYPALIMDVNYQYSTPIQFALSPFVKGQVSFDQLVSHEMLLKEGAGLLQKFKEGAMIKVQYMKDGQFSLVGESKAKGKLQKGELRVVRFVKAVQGKGITVQIDAKTFGFIEICEITDDIVGRLIDSVFQTQPIFVARIVDFDKNEKPILSSRESVLDQALWEGISSGKTIQFQKADEKYQAVGNFRNKILKFGAQVAINEGDLCLGYIVNINKSGCFIQIGHNTTVRAGLNELSDKVSFDFTSQMPLGRQVLARIYKVDDKTGQKRFNASLRQSLVVHGVNALSRDSLQEGSQLLCTILAKISDEGKYFSQLRGSYLKVKVKGAPTTLKEGENVIVTLTKVTKQKLVGNFDGLAPKEEQSKDEKKIHKLWASVEEEAQKDIVAMKETQQKAEIDQEALATLVMHQDENDEQLRDLKELQEDEESMEVVQEDDSDAEEMERIIRESKVYEDAKSEDEDDDDEEEDENDEEEDEEMSEPESEGDGSQEEDEDVDMDSDSDDPGPKNHGGKKTLKSRIKEEQEIRAREKQLRDNTTEPHSQEDFERLLIQNQDQSYVWIQYLAFMLDRLGIESARRIAERSVKAVSLSNEEDKYNLWVAYMNLENNFGTQETLEKVIKRALEVNDRLRVYLQLIGIYQNSQKYQYIEAIYKQLCKKYNTQVKIWTGYLEFLFLIRSLKTDQTKRFIVENLEVSEPKSILQKALQVLSKDQHVSLISKYGQLEFKHGNPENGRTMFEGIVANYGRRMDVWGVYMDMEVKYGGENKQQARHLFERCLANDYIKKKPKKMKLVFQKYMEYEMANGNQKQVDKLRERVEQYLETAFTKKDAEGSESD